MKEIAGNILLKSLAGRTKYGALSNEASHANIYLCKISTNDGIVIQEALGGDRSVEDCKEG